MDDNINNDMPALWRNVYRNNGDWGQIIVSEKFYESVEQAAKNIQRTGALEYMYTAKMTSEIVKVVE